MNTRRSPQKVSFGLAAAILVTSCANHAEVARHGNAAQGPDPKVVMAMENMRRIMMMPEQDRMQYVTEAQAESLSRGMGLFEDRNLGKNGQACASCHIGGRSTGGLVEMMPGMKMPIPDLHGVAATFPKYKIPNDAVITLAEMNNNCLVMFQAGTPLSLDGQQARDLAAYVASLKD